jgi:hypothetical protein
MEIRNIPGFAREAEKNCVFERARVSDEGLRQLGPGCACLRPRLPLKGVEGLTKATRARVEADLQPVGFALGLLQESCAKTPLACALISAKMRSRPIGETECCCRSGGKDRLANTWGWGFRPCPGSRRRCQLGARWVFKMEVRFILAHCCVPLLPSQFWCYRSVGWASEPGNRRGCVLML